MTRIASTVPWLTLAMEWWDGFRLIAGEALIWWLIAYGCLYVFFDVVWRKMDKSGHGGMLNVDS